LQFAFWQTRSASSSVSPPRGRLTAALVFAVALAACGSEHARTRPVEVPISDYKVEPRDPTIPSGYKEQMIPVGQEDSDGKAEVSAVATKLDAKNGFAGVQMGAGVKSIRGLKLADKNGDRASYRMVGKTPSYAGAAFKDVLMSFSNGKLASMVFAVKSNNDCKTVREALDRDLGPTQKATPAPNETLIWRGDKVGLRFSMNSSGSCGGTLLSHELADPSAWAGLEP
jgi:hypothetical protein